MKKAGLLWIVVLVAGCLIPFADRAYYIDDPLFLWTARQIRSAPAHFYGYNLNWSGYVMHMTDVMCNPPLMAFLLAVASLVVGWRELALHLVCLLPAIAAALGTWQLAKDLGTCPLNTPNSAKRAQESGAGTMYRPGEPPSVPKESPLASLSGFLPVALLVLTPGFLVCATSVMCDTTMLAFWVWSIVLWERGLASGRYVNFILAGLLGGLCGLAKYSGFSVVPLLLACALVRHPKLEGVWRPSLQGSRTFVGLGSWIFALLIPVAMLGAYEWIAYRTHGVVLLENAAAYAREVRPASFGELPSRLVTGLVFAGGCALPVLALAPCLWSRRALAAGVALFMLILAAPPIFGSLKLAVDGNGFGPGALCQNAWLVFKGSWPLEGQRALWLLGGLSIVALAIADFWRARDAASAILGLWTLGVLTFASLCNWTINGRSVLPMLPAVAILLTRRLNAGAPRTTLHAPRSTLHVPLLLLAALGAFAVAAADYHLANTARQAAHWVAAKYGTPPSRLWFEGHWGFQYYLQQQGAKPLDIMASSLAPGDVIVVPSSEASGQELPLAATSLEEVLSLRANSWLTTMGRPVGAGFHSDFWGPLPFALGGIEPDRYYVFKVVRPFKYASWAPVLDPAVENQDELLKLQARLQSNPGDTDAYFQLSLLRMRQSQLPEAITALLDLLRVRPDDFRAHVQLGQLYSAAGKAAEAKAQYYAALKAMPDSPGVLNNLAWLLATDADPAVRNGSDAVRLARRACALTLRKSPMALGTLAAAYAEAGRFSDAVSTAEAARDLAAGVNQPALAERNRQLLELYLAGKAYHEPPR